MSDTSQWVLLGEKKKLIRADAIMAVVACRDGTRVYCPGVELEVSDPYETVCMTLSRALDIEDMDRLLSSGGASS